MRSAQRVLQYSVPAWLFDINSLVAVEVDFTEWHEPPPAPEWPHRWAGENDVEFLNQGGLSETEVRAMLAEGAHVALCTKDDKLVSYVWCLTGQCSVFDWIKVLLEGDIYGAAAYVAPEFRGRNLRNETRRFTYPGLINLGYSRSFSFVEHLNRSSMRTGRASYRRYIGRLSFLRILGLVIYRIDSQWGAGFWSRSRPFELSFDIFDRENFTLIHKDARSALEDS